MYVCQLYPAIIKIQLKAKKFNQSANMSASKTSCHHFPMSVSIALNDGCDKPGEFSVAINSFKWDGPLPVTILPHTARTFMSKRFDPGTFGLLSKLNFCEHP